MNHEHEVKKKHEEVCGVTTVGDYLRKLAGDYGMDVTALVDRYEKFRDEGSSREDALRQVEAEVKGQPAKEGLSKYLPADGRAPDELATELTARKEEEFAKGDADEFVKRAKEEVGEWIRASELKEGDEMTVTGPGEVDHETFDRSYLCVPVRFKNVERKIRLGAKNVERIIRALGNSTMGWVGAKLRVTLVEVMPGLSKQRGVETKRAVLDGAK